MSNKCVSSVQALLSVLKHDIHLIGDHACILIIVPNVQEKRNVTKVLKFNSDICIHIVTRRQINQSKKLFTGHIIELCYPIKPLQLSIKQVTPSSFTIQALSKKPLGTIRIKGSEAKVNIPSPPAGVNMRNIKSIFKQQYPQVHRKIKMFTLI